MRRSSDHAMAAALGTSLVAALLAAMLLSMRRKHKWKEPCSWLEFITYSPKVCFQGKLQQGLSSEIRQGSKELGSNVREGVLGAIGNTPLIRIGSLSDATGCEIYGKAEFLNPGGSVKDRVAAKILDEALQSGALRVGGVVTEGSAGSTAVSLAMVALAHGCRCHVVLPDDAAIEKTQILESMGATVERVRPVSITHKDHFVNVARRRASEAQADVKGISSPQPVHLNHASDGLRSEGRPEAQAQTQSLEAHNNDIADKAVMEQNVDQFLTQSFGTVKAAEEQIANCQKGCEMIHMVPDLDQCLSISGPDAMSRGILEREILEENKYAGPELTSRQNEASGNCCSSGQGGFFADQFENLANFRAHYEGTAPELWRQTGGRISAFVAAAGTGGTIAGVSRYLKEQDQQVKCYLIDPPGSGLYNRVTRGVMYTKVEAEGKRMKNPFDTITEGIGINRLTENFKQAELDGAFRGTDKEAVEMARYLMKNDGLFVGSSSAMNCVGAVRVARLLGPGHVIATILCDGGARHLSKFHNPAYLAAQGLTPSATSLEFLEHDR